MKPAALILLLLAAQSFALNPQIVDKLSVNISLYASGNFDLNANGVLSIINPSQTHYLLGGTLNYTIPDYLSIAETDPGFREENRNHLDYANKIINFEAVENVSELYVYYKIFGNGLNNTESLPVNVSEYMVPDPSKEFVWAGDQLDYFIEITNRMGRNVTVARLEKEFSSTKILYARVNASQPDPELSHRETTPGDAKSTAGTVLWKNFTIGSGETAILKLTIVPLRTPTSFKKTTLELPLPPQTLENRVAIEKVLSENTISVEKRWVNDTTFYALISYYNPTPFTQEIRALRMLKTSAPDVNLNNAALMWKMENASIIVNTGEEFRYSMEETTEVIPMYWVSAKYSTITDLKKEAGTTVIYEEEKRIPYLQYRPVPYSPTPVMSSLRESGLTERPLMVVTKKIENTRIMVGEPFRVTLAIKNPRLVAEEGVAIKDYVPDGFELAENGKSGNRTLEWTIPLMASEQEVELTYWLVARKKGIHTLPPATVSVKGVEGSIFSNYVIVNAVKKEEYGLPKKMPANAREEAEPEVLVLKTIKKTDYGYEVRLKTMNVGNVTIQSLGIADPLPNGSRIYNIVPFAMRLGNKLEWRFGEVPAGVWRAARYATAAREMAATIPLVRGVPPDRVATSIVFSPVINEKAVNRSREMATIAILATLFAIAFVKTKPPKKIRYCPNCGRRYKGRLPEHCTTCGKDLTAKKPAATPQEATQQRREAE